MAKMFRRIKQYFLGSYNELKLVVWPPRKQVIRETTLVIIFSIVVAVFLGALDLVFNFGLDQIISLK